MRLAGLDFLGLLAVLSTVSSAGAVVKHPIPRRDPFVDPKHDPYNPLRYIATNSLTAVAFSLVLLVGLLQSLCMKRWGARWMLSMVIGAYTFAFGLATRFGLHLHPQSKGLYIVEYLFVVLSPCAFIASDYVLLGQIARHLGVDEYLLISPRRITVVFILSDVTTFLIQAIGGALSVSANHVDQALVGSRVFLAGLAAQLVSFIVFTCVYLLFLWRVRKHRPEVWSVDKDKAWSNDWRALAAALFISCIGILIRSVFRVVELSEGFQGHLATSEAFFYALDTLPLFMAIAIYIPFWPGRILASAQPNEQKAREMEKEEVTRIE